MSALHLVTSWPVEHVAAAIVTPHGVEMIGDTERIYRIASLSKPIVAWAIMVGVEEGVVGLDAPLVHVDAPDGATLRHLLSHAAGYNFSGAATIAPVGARRIYSNTGIELAAAELAGAAQLRFETYLGEAVFEPLGMSSAELRGSPAQGVHASVNDITAFVSEMRRPTLFGRNDLAPGDRTSVPHAGRYRAGRGPIRSVPLGIGGRAAWCQDTSLDGPLELARGIRTLRWFGHDDVGRPIDRHRRGGAHGPRLRPVEHRRPATLARVLRRRGGRTAGGGVSFQPGDRVRWATTGDDGLPIVRYGFVGGLNGDHTRVAVMLDGDLAGDTVVDIDQLVVVSITTVELRLDGADLLDDPSLRQGLVNLWSAEADQAGLEIRSIECLGTGVRDGDAAFALANLWAGTDQYVLRAEPDPHLDTVNIRAEYPRW